MDILIMSIITSNAQSLRELSTVEVRYIDVASMDLHVCIRDYDINHNILCKMPLPGEVVKASDIFCKYVIVSNN